MMMQVTALLLSCALVVMAAPRSTSPAAKQAELLVEFKDFIAVMPMQQMYNTLVEHLNTDAELQAALRHVQGKEFQQIHAAFAAKSAVKEIKMKYRDAGLDVDRYEQMINNIVSGLTFIDTSEDAERSFGKFLADIDKMIPYDKLMVILKRKLEKSPVFIRFFDEITDDVMRTLYDKVMISVEFKHLAQELEDMDVPVYQILDALYSIFGWNNKQSVANDL